MFEMGKVLVTGGAGFIGSHLVEALCDDHDVVVIDDLSTGKLENLENVRERIVLHKKSILDKGIKEDLRDVEVIFHHAAQIDVRRSVEDPMYDLDVNGKGTINLIENAPDLERMIYASSGGAVYGEPEYLPVDENHKTEPISPYGISKLVGEKYLDYYSYTYGLKTCSLRYGNVYGPRQDPLGEAGVIAIFLDRLSKNKRPIIFGDGEQTRDFVHVTDVVEANLLAMEREGVFNIGTGVETSVNGLVQIMSKVIGRGIEPSYADERKGEVKRIYLDIRKAREILGWEPRTTLEEGIKDLWKG
ncbi:MAG: GDP-mannose 4,6-dehydratase [Candidatus Hydrothermarchaeales archaeon]